MIGVSARRWQQEMPGGKWGVGLWAGACQDFCALLTQAASVEARCIRKAPSEPLICGTTGGEVRRSCLSPRSGRVLRRPPVVSSAGESSAKPTTGEAGSPFLPTSLATQRSRAPAGRRRGFAKHRFAPPKPAGCANPAVESRPGQCDAKQRKAPGPHQRTAIQVPPSQALVMRLHLPVVVSQALAPRSR